MKIIVNDNSYEVENEHDLAQIKKIIEKINLDKKGQGVSLQTKTLDDIVKSDRPFYIKNYQRGYRWSKTEITELLKDIYAIDSEHYCMQPIVVAECNEDLSDKKSLKDIDYPSKKVSLDVGDKHEKSYELIDGQQRLTTLWIIRQRLSQYASGLNLDNYQVYYELDRGVDKYYLDNAVECVDKFFKKSARSNAQNDEQKIKKFVENLEKLFFIWYEVNSNQNAVFKSLNAGKIPLTNAELFKAMLLNEDDDKQASSVYERIAFEWDSIEKSLRNDDFWYFISNDTSDEKTRIDYVLEVYANSILKELGIHNLDIDKERFSFLAIQQYMQDKAKSAQDIWKGVVETYNTLYSWYKNDDLYHAIGFLVASKNKKVGSKATASEVILELYKENSTKSKSDLVGIVQNKIRETYFQKELEDKNKTNLLVSDCAYDKLSKAHLRAILLMSNIYATYYAVDEGKRTVRFPFHIYKANGAGKTDNNEHYNFDIEHIKPQTIAMLDGSEDCFSTAIEALKVELECDLNEPEKSPNKDVDTLQENIIKIKDGNKDECKKIWNEYAKKHNEAPDNELSNLVLLNSDINRSYHNAFFNEKRKKIIEEDKSGVYIPICTKNAFLKYYGNQDKDTNLIWWTQNDKNNYEAELTKMFEMIWKWGRK